MQVHDIKELNLSHQPTPLKAALPSKTNIAVVPKRALRPLFSSRVQYNCPRGTITAALRGSITLPEGETIREWKACACILYPFAHKSA